MSILISYSLSDSPFALKLGYDLQRLGVNVIVDRWDSPLQESWADWQRQCFMEADAFLVVMSPAYIASTYCQTEWSELNHSDVPSFVAVIQSSLFHADWLTENIQKGYIDFSDSNEVAYQANLKKLTGHIKSYLPNAVRSVLSEPTQLVLENLYQLACSATLHEMLIASGVNELTETSTRPKILFPAEWLAMPQLVTSDGVQLSGYELGNRLLQERWLILSGDHAVGKTTMLQSLALMQWQRMWLGQEVAYLPVVISALDEAFWQKLRDCVSGLQQYFSDKQIVLLIDDADYFSSLQSLMNDLQKHSTSERIAAYLFAVRPQTDFVGISSVAFADWTLASGMAFLQERFPIRLSPIMISKTNPFWYIVASINPEERSEIHLLDHFVTKLSKGAYQHTPASADSLRNLIDVLGDVAYRAYLNDDPFVMVDLSPSATPIEWWLKPVGERYAFRNKAFLRYFAVQWVMRRGVVASLGYPEIFSGERVYRPLDDLIEDCVELSHTPVLLLQEIAEVDALLALQIGMRQLFQEDVKFCAWLMENAIIQVKDQVDFSILLNTLLHQPHEPILASLLWVLRVPKPLIQQLAYDLLLRLTPQIVDAYWQEWVNRIIASHITLKDALQDVQEQAHALVMLLQQLYHPTHTIRQASVRLLAQSANEAFIYPMRQAVYDEDEQVALTAISFLATSEDEAAIYTLIDLLEDARPKIREATMGALQQGNMFVKEIIHKLLAPAIEKPLQIKLLDLLRGYDSPQILQTVLSLSEHTDDDIRTAAILALEKQSQPEVVDRLMKAQSLDDAVAKREARPIREIAMDLLRALGFSFGSESTAKVQNPNVLQSEGMGSSADQLKNRLKAQKETLPSNNDTLQLVLQSLKHEQVAERVNGLSKIANLSLEDALAVINQALLDESQLVRLQAVQLLANLNHRHATQMMVELLLDRDPSIVEKVRTHLLEHGTQFVPQLLSLLDNPTPNQRVAIVELLGKIGDPFAISKLSALLSDQAVAPQYHKRVCDAVIEALQQIGTKEALNLVNWWRTHQRSTPNPVPNFAEKVVASVRVDGLASPPVEILPLDPTEPNRTTLPLAPLMSQSIPLKDVTESPIENTTILNRILFDLLGKSWGSREDAAKALREYAKTHSQTENQVLLGILTPLLEDQDWSVRTAAIEALAWLHDTSIVPDLIPILQDKKWVVRSTVIRALTELKDLRAVKGIITCLDDVHTNVREAAAEALGILRTPESLKALKENLQQDDPYIRLAVVNALSQYHEAEMIQPLLSAVDDIDVNVRWTIIQSLAKIRNDRIVPALIDALQDESRPNWEDERICDLALSGLRHINSPESIIAIEEWKKKQNI